MPARKNDGFFSIMNYGMNMAQGMVQPGTVNKHVNGDGSPGPGWLYCNGQSVLRATFPALFNAIGTRYGAADGTHFNVPDMRGRFARGWANGSSTEPTPERNGRFAAFAGGTTGDNVGSYQIDCFQAHIIGYNNGQIGPTTGPGGSVTPNASAVLTTANAALNSGATPSGYSQKREAVGSQGFNGSWGNDVIMYPITWSSFSGITRAPSMGTESRPVNVNYTFWIKT